MMALEADRMRHLNVDAKEFEQEIKVVMEERRMRTDDNPQAKLFEQMNAAAFQAHPYRRPIIGWMNDLENMTAADAKAWYDTWYVPNNAYVVITGDVDHQAVFALAEQHYGPLEGARPAAAPPADRTEAGRHPSRHRQGAGRTARADHGLQGADPARRREGQRSLRAGNARRHPRRPRRRPLQQETGARGQGRRCRPASSTTTRRAARACSTCTAAPSEGKTVADLEAALRAEIARVQKDGVSEAELKRAKAQLVAGEVYKKRFDVRPGHGNRPDRSGRPVLPEASTAMLERLQQVTAAQIQAVAKKYFDDDALTVGALDPQPLDGKPRRPAVATRH